VTIAAWAAAAAAVLFRAAAILDLHGTPLTRVMVGDAMGYLDTARRIAEGRWSEIGVFFQSPLYPLLLAPLASLADSVWMPVAVLQACAGSLACFAIARCSAIAFPLDPLAPWLAGLAAAAYGPLVFHDVEVLPASLGASLVACGMLAALGAGHRLRSLVAGLLLGAASLLVPSLGLVALWCAAWIGVRGARQSRRQGVTLAACVIGGVAAMLLPVAAWNLAAGDVVLVTSSGGVNAFIGNNPAANGAFVLPPASGLDGARLEQSARERAEQRAGRSLRPSEVSASWAGRAWSWVRSAPGDWARLLGRKVLLVLNHYEIPNHVSPYFVAERFAWSLRATLPFWCVLPFAVVGGALTRRSGGRGKLLLVGMVLVGLLVPVAFFVTGRYRLPVAPPLLALAGGGAGWLVRSVRRGAWGGMLAGVLVIAGVTLVSRVPLVRERDYAFDHLVLGSVQRSLGRFDEAVIEFKLAEETGPPELRPSLWLAQALAERGNRDEALDALERHVERFPDDAAAAAALARLRAMPPRPHAPRPPRTDYEIGRELSRSGSLDAAAAALTRAVRRDPTHALALGELARTRQRQGRLDEALSLLDRAVELDPTDARNWRDLAAYSLQADRTERARVAARHALSLDPHDAATRAIVERLGTGPEARR